jgi:hypothetical protein
MRDLRDIFITKDNEEWIKVIESQDLNKFRKFLKKEKDTLPPEHRRLYLKDNLYLKDLMYTLILTAPGLTHLKSTARNYYRSKCLKPSLVGNFCSECTWFRAPPLIEDNPDLGPEERKKSCKELGALSTEIACEGFKQEVISEQKRFN